MKYLSKLFIIILFVIIIITIIILLSFYFFNKNSYKNLKIELTNYQNQLNKLSEDNDNNINKKFSKLPIKVINLKKSKERKSIINKSIQKLKIKNVKFFEAIDGETIDINPYLGTNIFTANSNNKIVNFAFDSLTMNKLELGCLLSHILVIKQSLEENLDKVLIIEDDANLDLAVLWEKSLQDIITIAPKNWEFISLVSNACIQKKKQINNSKENMFIKYPYNCYSLTAYIINRNGMKKIVKNLFDSNLNLINLNKIKIIDKILLNLTKNNNNISNKVLKYVYLKTRNIFVSDFIIPLLLNSYTYKKVMLAPNNIEIDSTIHSNHNKMHHKLYLNSLKELINPAEEENE